MNEPERCAYLIEKDWPGHTAVLSRRRCKRIVKDGERYCWQHRTEYALRCAGFKWA